METIIERIRQEFKSNADEKSQEALQRFFKEEVKGYGVKSSTVHKISKEFFKEIKDKPKAEIFDLCETLWKSGYIDESVVACNWSYYVHKTYEPSDFETFERWIQNYVNNWASCDTLCNPKIRMIGRNLNL